MGKYDGLLSELQGLAGDVKLPEDLDSARKATISVLGKRQLSFSQALILLRAGATVARQGWNGKDQFVYKLNGGFLASGVGYGFGEYVGEPTFDDILVLRNQQNRLVSWVPSIGDLMATDWVVVGRGGI